MIVTQIAAFAVLVAVPVGAAVYCGYAFFQKRHQAVWTRKDFYPVGVLIALTVIYAVGLGRQYLLVVMSPFLAAMPLYILMRFMALRQAIKNGQPIIIAEIYVVIGVAVAVFFGLSGITYLPDGLLRGIASLIVRPPQEVLYFVVTCSACLVSLFLAYKTGQKTKPFRMEKVTYMCLAVISCIVVAYVLYVLPVNYRVYLIVLFGLLFAAMCFLWFCAHFIEYMKKRSASVHYSRLPVPLYIVAFLCAGGLASLFIGFLLSVNRVYEVWSFFLFAVLPPGLVFLLERRKMISGKQPSASLAGLGYMMVLVGYMTVQFNYYPMFVQEYRCIKSNGRDYVITTGHPTHVRPPNVFEKIFRNNEQWKGLCFCPEGRTGLKSYERGSLCLSASEAGENWQNKTEDNGD